MEDERNWFVGGGAVVSGVGGVDWASETHHVRLSDAKGRKVGERAFAHGGQGLVELREWSRIADDLRAERNRLGNRVRELLWRYWFLDLWRLRA